VDSDDVWMAQSGDGSRLLLEAAEAIRVCGKRWRQNLQRDVAAKTSIAGLVNLAYSARSDEGES
jgi:hypothetical protein